MTKEQGIAIIILLGIVIGLLAYIAFPMRI